MKMSLTCLKCAHKEKCNVVLVFFKKRGFYLNWAARVVFSAQPEAGPSLPHLPLPLPASPSTRAPRGRRRPADEGGAAAPTGAITWPGTRPGAPPAHSRLPPPSLSFTPDCSRLARLRTRARLARCSAVLRHRRAISRFGLAHRSASLCTIP
jgi:hypothetical protein